MSEQEGKVIRSDSGYSHEELHIEEKKVQSMEERKTLLASHLQ